MSSANKTQQIAIIKSINNTKFVNELITASAARPVHAVLQWDQQLLATPPASTFSLCPFFAVSCSPNDLHLPSLPSYRAAETTIEDLWLQLSDDDDDPQLG